MGTPRKVAILVEEGYQDLELWHPLLRLREENIPVSVIGPEAEKTYISQLEFPVVPDAGISDVKAADFGAVIVSGGQSANRIAENAKMVAFIREAAKNGAVLAAVSNGAKAFEAAGAKPAVSVKNTDSLPEFCKALLQAL
jgi:protease I